LEVSLLATALNKNHKVTIASMARDSGHQALAFTTSGNASRMERFPYRDAMRGKTTKLDGFSGIIVHEFYSRPADAVSIMLGEIMKHDLPDLVICGISNGTNLGPDVYSSSNVGMAMEATFFGVPAITIATEFNPGGNTEAHLKHVIKLLETNLEEFANINLPPYTFLNINVPRSKNYKDLKGIRYTRLGKVGKLVEYDAHTAPDGRPYYWTRFARGESCKHPMCDRASYEEGFVSITPLNYNSTIGGLS